MIVTYFLLAGFWPIDEIAIRGYVAIFAALVAAIIIGGIIARALVSRRRRHAHLWPKDTANPDPYRPCPSYYDRMRGKA